MTTPYISILFSPLLLLLLLQLLACMSAHPEGQRVMLHATAAPALLDLAVATLQAPASAAATPALLLLRNLSFHSAIRSPILSNKQLLPMLLAAAECLLPGKLPSPESLVPHSNGNGKGIGVGSSNQTQKQQQQWVVPYGKPDVPAAAASGFQSSSSRPGTAGGYRNSPAVATGGGGGGGGGSLSDGKSVVALRRSRGGGSAVGKMAVGEGKEGGAGRRKSLGAAAGDEGGAGGGVGRVVGAAGNVCCAVYATSALWALVYQGEALKAAVRKLPDGMSRLVAVQAHAAWLRGGLAAGGEGGGAAVVLRQLSCVAASPLGSRDVGRWLEELEGNCEVVLQLMHST
jgi:hypothetical protein